MLASRSGKGSSTPEAKGEVSRSARIFALLSAYHIMSLGRQRDMCISLLRPYPDSSAQYNFKKSTFASQPSRPSASVGSKSFYDSLDIIVECSEQIADFPSYNVHDVISGTGESHKEVCDDVSTWLKMKRLKYPLCTSNARVNTEVFLKEMVEDQSWLKRDKRVDVAILSACYDIPSVQIEVESNNSVDHTLFKLMCGLVDQLRYLMNRSINITEVAGFFVPVNVGYVRKVVCMWSDRKLEYVRRSFKLKKDDVFTEIRDAFMNQSEFETNVFSHGFTFPLSPKFVRENFATDAYQLKSGNSVVIMCPSERSVYKCPLTGDDFRRLSFLLQSEFNSSLQYSSLPIAMKMIDSKLYFKYIALNMPLNKEDALKVIRLLVTDVVEAIKELHNVGVAHLDIRLENICYNDNGHAMLIDLGRSVKTTETNFKSYGNSQMYYCPNVKWMAQNGDWKQLAMMVHYILNQAITDYHEIVIDRETYPDLFLYTMFSKGEFDQTLFDQWLSNQAEQVH